MAKDPALLAALAVQSVSHGRDRMDSRERVDEGRWWAFDGTASLAYDGGENRSSSSRITR